MELTKNIFFNTDKLVENTKVKISYTGKLFQDASNEVVMEKTDLGFQAEIILGEGSTFNFCFKDENNNWDNNDGQNYIFNLEKLPTELLVLDDEPVSLGSAKKLRRAYLWSKKIRLAVYKIITYLPKIISGNYKKKSTNNNEN